MLGYFKDYYIKLWNIEKLGGKNCILTKSAFKRNIKIQNILFKNSKITYMVYIFEVERPLCANVC